MRACLVERLAREKLARLGLGAFFRSPHERQIRLNLQVNEIQERVLNLQEASAERRTESASHLVIGVGQ